MSLDNVIAVAAAAGGHWVLMIVGLAISIPIVIFGATLLVKLMERWPIIITIGAGADRLRRAGRWRGKILPIAAFTSPYPPSMKYAAAIGGRGRSVWGNGSPGAMLRAGESRVSESNAAR